MTFDDKTIADLLKNYSLLSEGDINSMLVLANANNMTLYEYVTSHQHLSDDVLNNIITNNRPSESATIDIELVDPEVVKLLPENIARVFSVIVFHEDKVTGQKHIAMVNPKDTEAVAILARYFGGNFAVYTIDYQQFETLLDKYQQHTSTNLEQDHSLDYSIELLIIKAIEKNASDLHIDPGSDRITVRFRIDGQLQDILELPNNLSNRLFRAVKKMASIDVFNISTPQTGFVNFRHKSVIYRLKVNTIPVIGGEKINLHIYQSEPGMVNFDDLGLYGQPLRSLASSITQKQGLILISGPLGSGRSATIRSILMTLGGHGKNIATIEEDVEIRLKNISQTVISERYGVGYKDLLSNISRQDFDIIMLQEFIDSSTTNQAIELATSGKLIIGAINSPDSSSALLRLLQMGIEPHLLNYSLKSITAQRLVRKINPKDCQSFIPSESQLKEIRQKFDIKSEKQWQNIQKNAQEIAEKLKIKMPAEVTFWQPKASLPKDRTGYSGRIGVFESIVIDDELTKLLISYPNSQTLRNYCIKNGLITFAQDALIKAMLGITSLDEALKII